MDNSDKSAAPKPVDEETPAPVQQNQVAYNDDVANNTQQQIESQPNVSVKNKSSFLIALEMGLLLLGIAAIAGFIGGSKEAALFAVGLGLFVGILTIAITGIRGIIKLSKRQTDHKELKILSSIIILLVVVPALGFGALIIFTIVALMLFPPNS